jgi:hypothetical protein
MGPVNLLEYVTSIDEQDLVFPVGLDLALSKNQSVQEA